METLTTFRIPMHDYQVGDRVDTSDGGYRIRRIIDRNTFTIGPWRWYHQLWAWVKRRTRAAGAWLLAALTDRED